MLYLKIQHVRPIVSLFSVNLRIVRSISILSCSNSIMEHWNKHFVRISSILSSKNHDYHKKWNFQLGVVNSPQRRAGAMMNGTWNIANRILLLRVSQTLILQVRLSAFEGPHDAPCRRLSRTIRRSSRKRISPWRPVSTPFTYHQPII